MRRLLLGLILVVVTVPALAQRVDSRNTHERRWAIDRVVLDQEGVAQPAHAQGMLGFVAIYNADNTLCLVEYVAERNADFDSLRDEKDPRVRVFDKGRTKPAVFKAAARAAGFLDFDLDKIFARVP